MFLTIDFFTAVKPKKDNALYYNLNLYVTMHEAFLCCNLNN